MKHRKLKYSGTAAEEDHHTGCGGIYLQKYEVLLLLSRV